MAQVSGEAASVAPRGYFARHSTDDQGREVLVEIYLDASVLVPLVVDEAGSARAWAIVEQQVPLWTSEFAAAEVASALSRLVRTNQLDGDAAVLALTDFARWRFDSTSDVPIETADVRLAHDFVRRFDTHLRVPDALHLALSQRRGASFASFDTGAIRAAAMLEIPVVI